MNFFGRSGFVADAEGDGEGRQDTAAAAGHLPRLEGKVDAILQRLSINGYEAVEEEEEARLSPTVRHFLSRGSKIHAIKAYREESGCGLKEAKDAVEGVEREDDADADARRWRVLDRKLDLILRHLGGGGEEEETADAEEALPELQELVRTGRKLEAIKVYREENNCGLKEAKDAVDALFLQR